MDAVFIKVLNMSISASWLVLVVLALRFLLKKSPRWVRVALWALVAVRLVCPFSIESVFSLIPSTETLPREIVYSHSPAIDSGVPVIDDMVNSSVMEDLIPHTGASVNPIQIRLFVDEIIWFAGMTGMIVWALVSYLRLKRKVSASLALGNGVYLCDYIDTPFILGIAVPKIYLPSAMEPAAAAHVLAHERAHIARRDHWWKPFGYLLLTVHWFNPLLWLGYILLCRDIELACDEKVVRELGLPERKSYSEALLKCSVSRRHVAACPLAFGEVGVKERVKTVLHYKKPAFWIVLVAVLALIVTAVCFLTDPVKKLDATYRVEEVVYRNPAISYYMTEEAAPQFEITGDNTLRINENGEDWVELGEFSEIRLSDLNFGELFFGEDMDQIQEKNQKAWLLSIPPREELNSSQFYLLLLQENGEIYLADGIVFHGVYPIHDTVLDASHMVSWLYRLTEADSYQAPETVSPYEWTSTLRREDVSFSSAWLGEGDWAADSVEGAKLAELVVLLNQVREDQLVSKKPEGEYDPLWNLHGVNLWMSTNQDTHMLLRYVEDTLIISSTNYFGDPNGGYWTIENQKLKDWMQNLSYGGTHMLSEANREEIRQLLKMDYVEFFDPQEYEDYLFIGCGWDHDRGLGVACFEKQENGYKLLRLIRGADIKTCASGSKLHYCDYQDLRIFLVMNDSVTAMEWIGENEKTLAIDTHPGLVVAYFPEGWAAEYRFRYNGGTTMYMDRDNNTISDYREDRIREPMFFQKLMEFSIVDGATVGETVDVDEYYMQDRCMRLQQSEISHLMYLLSVIPESAVEPVTEYYRRDRHLYISLVNEKTGDQQSIQLLLDNGCVYYSYVPSEPGVVYDFWKIDFPELTAFLNSLYEVDASGWETFAKYPKSDGVISFEARGVKVTVPNLLCFEYEQTESGIRFKPEDAESWVELQYHTEPFGVCGTGLKTFEVIYGGHSGTKGVYDSNEYWSFMDLKPRVGDVAYNIVLLNEDTWVEQYDHEMLFLLNLMTFETTE